MKKTFNIKRSLLDNINRELIISDDFLSFHNKDTREHNITQFLKDDIVAYRYGMEWISFEITYGREYLVYIKNKKGKELKINFKSIFGKNKKAYHQQYLDILDALWQYYFSKIAEEYLKKFNNGEVFSIANVKFDNEGVEIKVAGILKEKTTKILWENVRTSDFYDYFVIFSVENPTDINRTYKYLDEDNIAILYTVIRYILRNKGVEDKLSSTPL